MKIGDVSTKLGMPASTIRYYEKIGLIDPQRRVSGRREFDDRALFALKFVRLSQAAAETKTLMAAYTDNPSPAGVWQALAEGKRTAIRTQIKEFRQMDCILTELLSCKCKSLTECVEKGMNRHASD